jgi:hypothetical protein
MALYAQSSVIGSTSLTESGFPNNCGSNPAQTGICPIPAAVAAAPTVAGEEGRTFTLSTISIALFPKCPPIVDRIPRCQCQNFVNGLTTSHVGRHACAKHQELGFQGVQTFCSMPDRPNIPLVDDGCPSGTQLCVVEYTPPVVPKCHCDTFTNDATPTATELCQKAKKGGATVCSPLYDAPKNIGGLQYFNCPEDQHRCAT